VCTVCSSASFVGGFVLGNNGSNGSLPFQSRAFAFSMTHFR